MPILFEVLEKSVTNEFPATIALACCDGLKDIQNNNREIFLESPDDGISTKKITSVEFKDRIRTKKLLLLLDLGMDSADRTLTLSWQWSFHDAPMP